MHRQEPPDVQICKECNPPQVTRRRPLFEAFHMIVHGMQQISQSLPDIISPRVPESSGRSNSPVRSAWDIDARLTWFLDFDRFGVQRSCHGGVVVLTHDCVFSIATFGCCQRVSESILVETIFGRLIDIAKEAESVEEVQWRTKSRYCQVAKLNQSPVKGEIGDEV